jgi:hypothetical protein
LHGLSPAKIPPAVDQPWITVRFGYDNFDIISLAGGVHDYEMVLKYV